MNPVDPSTRPATAGSPLRLRPWPGDPRVGVVLPTDHQTVPSDDDVARAVHGARRRGLVALRTGALFPRAAEVFHAAGFRTIDTLALLEIHLADVPDAAPADREPAVRTLRRWQHESAARVDRAAFGPLWGNDAATLREIRSATPVHHARRIDVDGELAAFAISGAAGRTGYLQRLAVDPRHQRRGLASSLVREALAWMRRRALTDAVVNTGVHNHAALALYAMLGFRRRSEQLVIAELVLDTRIELPRGDGTVDVDR